MKIKICTKVSASILTILAIMPNIISTAFSEAQKKSPIYLTLQGVVDLEYGKGPTDPYLVEGRLTGGTSYSLKWIYTNKERKQWDPNYGLIALSPFDYKCASTITAGTDLSTGTLEIIPGVNKVGMKLQHTDSQGQLTGNYVYVVPRLAYNIRLTGRGVGSGDGPRDSYSGVFFERAAGLVDRSTNNNSNWNICMTPPPGVYAPESDYSGDLHSRFITISIAGPLELYATKAMQPGRYSYKGNPLYIGSFAGDNDADSYAPLNITTDLNVVRICKITNVSQSNFNIVVGRETEIIKDSRFSYTCTADNKAIFISALAREGEVDGSNPSKLWFQRINGSRTANTPFLLGLPYGSGSDSSLTCQDVGKAGLLTFNNQEKTLLGRFSQSNIVQDLNIKWAICLNNNTEVGKYRARVEVAIHTKA